jgi:hypothetical protein
MTFCPITPPASQPVSRALPGSLPDGLFGAVPGPEAGAMLSGGAVHFDGRVVPALDAEHQAGAGEGRLPGNLEVSTFAAVRRPGCAVHDAILPDCPVFGKSRLSIKQGLIG